MFRLSLILEVLDGGIYQHACNQHDDTSSLRLLRLATEGLVNISYSDWRSQHYYL